MNLFFPYGIHVSGRPTKEFLRSLSGRGFVVHMFFVWYFNFQIPHFVVEICWPSPNFHFCTWRVKCLSHKQIRGLHLFWLWTSLEKFESGDEWWYLYFNWSDNQPIKVLCLQTIIDVFCKIRGQKLPSTRVSER